MEKMDLEEAQEDNESITDESEEESEIDEEQTDKNRIELSEQVKEMEDKFNKLKQDLIQEKLVFIEQKLIEIESETAKEFVGPVAKLKQNMEMRLKVAKLLRDYRLENIEHSYQYEKKSTHQTLENDKYLLFDCLKSKLENEINELEEKQKQIKEKIKQHEERERVIKAAQEMLINKKNFNQHIKTCEDSETNHRIKRTLIKTSEPCIVYSLRDYDIIEDCKIISQSLTMDSLPSSTTSTTTTTCLTVN